MNIRFSRTTKMPCLSWSIPATACKLGSILRKKPGSGCAICYAHKGSYRWSSTVRAMRNRLRQWQRVSTSQTTLTRFVRAFSGALNRSRERDPRYFRWFDSGDLQSTNMLDAIVKIARACPDRRFWLPTREAAMVRDWLAGNPSGFPENLVVRMSATMLGGSSQRIPGTARSTSSHADPPDGYLRCPAPTQSNVCGTCRACWDPQVDVCYQVH